jgi:Macrocin-O-methyltransferase (TylF)
VRAMNDSITFGLDPSKLRFQVGLFNETLPALIKAEPNIQFSIVRLDGDTYDATWIGLTTLYKHLSPGGYMIIDDYSDWRSCRAAVDTFRAQNKIESPMIVIPYKPGEESRGVYWRKDPIPSAIRTKYKHNHCIGDGMEKGKDGTVLRVSVRPTGSYCPNEMAPMPKSGIPGVNVLGLKGQKNLYYCK